MAKYEVALADDEDAQGILAARGLTEETAATFRLGVVADAEPGHGSFDGWIAIPYLLEDGTPVSIRFRRTDGQKKHKYMTLPGEPARTFNVGAILRAELKDPSEVHITEGEFDAMILAQCGLDAVAIPGATNWRGKHRAMLAHIERVFVWGDPDDAGAEFNRKVLQSLPRAEAVPLRYGDVTDTYIELDQDPEAIRGLIPKEGSNDADDE